MPKSNNKRKNGRKKGSTWNKKVAKFEQSKKDKKDAELEAIRKQILGE